MHVKNFYLLLLLSFTFAPGYSRQGALLSGNIQRTQKENFTLVVRSPFSTSTVTGVEYFSVPVDKQGNFSFRCRYKNTPLFLYESNEEGPYILLYLRESGLSVQWKDGALRQSFNIVKDTGNLNRISVSFQQLFGPVYDSLLNNRDDEPDFVKTVKAVNRLNEDGFQFLQQHRHDLDSMEYHQLAYDFYYRNLDLIVTAPHFSPLYKDPLVGRFPFIICYDHKYQEYYALRRKDAETLTIDPPRSAAYMDSVKEEMAWQFARILYRYNFIIADSNIISLSYAYRNFLNTYIYFLTIPFKGGPYPGIDSKTLVDRENFALWIHSIIQQHKVADWILVSQWIGDVRGHEELADSAHFLKMYNSLTDREIKEWLADRYAFVNEIQPGIKAPGFTLRDERNKTVSLSQFAGKAVFITFWSTSCGPCMFELKSCNKTVAEKYRNEPVIFVNIALDEDIKKWKETIKRLDIRGVNLIAANGWADETAKKYKIQGLPCHILIDDQGILQQYNKAGLCDLIDNGEFIKALHR